MAKENKLKSIVILFANEVIHERMTIKEVPKRIRQAVIDYILEAFGVVITEEADKTE